MKKFFRYYEYTYTSTVRAGFFGDHGMTMAIQVAQATMNSFVHRW
jgi:hypothetical protein